MSKWEADEFGDSVYYRDKDGYRIDFIKIQGGSPAIKQAYARLIADAPEMYELLKEELIPTSDYGGIVSFERERKIKKLLARIDGKKNEEAEHDCY